MATERMPLFVIRPAEMDDAPSASDVLRRSITGLCTVDHRDDPMILERWLANKTPETVRGWIAARGHTVLLAERDGSVAGVGGVTHAGEITLNYVAPGARFAGVSTAMLATLEKRLSRQGVRRSRLASTATAHVFYRNRGYVDVGLSVACGSMTEYRMTKQLRGNP